MQTYPFYRQATGPAGPRDTWDCAAPHLSPCNGDGASAGCSADVPPPPAAAILQQRPCRIRGRGDGAHVPPAAHHPGELRSCPTPAAVRGLRGGGGPPLPPVPLRLLGLNGKCLLTRGDRAEPRFYSTPFPPSELISWSLGKPRGRGATSIGR